MKTTKTMTTLLPSTLPVDRVRVSAHWSLAPSAPAIATCLVAGGSGLAGGESVARAERSRQALQVQTQGLRAQLQGTNGFVVMDYPTSAMKPVGGVRGKPPRGRPV